jgi:hypothetical protein
VLNDEVNEVDKPLYGVPALEEDQEQSLTAA